MLTAAKSHPLSVLLSRCALWRPTRTPCWLETPIPSLSAPEAEIETPPPPAWRRWAKLALKLTVTAIILVVVFRNFANLEEVWKLLLASNKLWLLGALLLFFLSKWLGAFRLNYFFRAAGVQLSERTNWKLYMLGMYYNLFLPGGVGGDGYKVLWLNRKGLGRKRDLVWPLLLDRISGLAALGALTVGILLVVPYRQYVPLPNAVWLWAEAALWAAVPVLYLIYFGVQHKLWPKYSTVFIPTGLYSIGVQVAQALAAVCILASMGQTTQLPEYLVLFYLSSIASVVPLTIGGLGSRELVFTLGAQWMGLDPHRAVVVGLVFYIITAIVSLAGIYYSYKPIAITDGTSRQ